MFGTAGVPMMPILWLIAVIILTVVEVATYQLVAVWFAVGGIAALVVSIFGVANSVQFIVFAAVSAVCIIGTRPLVKKALKVKKVETNYDRILGEIGIVISRITLEEKGRIMVDGLDWSAMCEPPAIVEKGEKVIVKRVVGVTAIVEKMANNK